MWVNLESVIYSEVKSEREKQISYISKYICGIEKMVQMKLFLGQEQRRRCRERTCRHGE